MCDRRLRRLFGAAGQSAGALLSGPCRRSRRQGAVDGRRRSDWNDPPSRSTEIPRTRRLAVRRLHAWLRRRGQGAARSQSQSHRTRSPLLAGRKSVPLYGLRQNRSRRARRGREHEECTGMSGERSFTYVGTRPIRHDGLDKVTGRANYGADFTLPGMLYGYMVRSPHAHARIVAIDTAAAEAMAGVKAVLTGNEIPKTDAKIM